MQNIAQKNKKKFLANQDPELAAIIRKELERQKYGLEMIPSENFVSPAVLEACGSVLTNKYSEGYPGRRYYGGNEWIDASETLAMERAKKLFGMPYANVQPHSGSNANIAAYIAAARPGSTIMGMSLSMGGHLTHGHPLNISGMIYRIIRYGVEKNGLIDMGKVRELAKAEKPSIIISGATAYPRVIDFAAFGEIAREIGAVHIADISHIAGLVAGGAHPHPYPHADIVTTTTHKTLRGPRGAVILSKEEYGPKIDKAIIPGTQGGPLEHIIAAKAAAFREALLPSFSDYARQIIKNAKALAETLTEEGLSLVSGGTDNHLILIDLTPLGMGGKVAEELLDSAGITVNKNMIPYDKRKPLDPSGIRLGTPALTTRGMRQKEMREIGRLIAGLLKSPDDESLKSITAKKVRELARQFPLYANL